MKCHKIQFYFVIAILAVGCGKKMPKEVAFQWKALPDRIDYNIHVKPLLSDRCYACHGPDENKRDSDLRLDLPLDKLDSLGQVNWKVAVKPGRYRKAKVFKRILSDDPEFIMPPPESHLVLTDREKAIILKWIDQGAVYEPHWSFIPPEMPEIPDVKNKDWPNNEIDHFICNTLESKGWSPAMSSTSDLWLRRVFFMITGLPPSYDQIQNFIKKDNPEYRIQIVDSLLASPHFGEKFAVDWLDLSRYADTHGYTVDRFRDMSPWRDWVIKALNENMPYDQFVEWQLAGDLLQNATHEQILATGFNRNHPQNMEGGIVDEEFRVEYVADRTQTFGTAFLGLTLECTKCHDHKFDPITQKEFFQLFSFFNNVNEAGQISWNNAAPVPGLLLPNAKKDSILQFLENKIELKEKEYLSTQDKIKENFSSQRLTSFINRKIKNIPKNRVALFTLENYPFRNQLNWNQKGVMKQQGVNKVDPQITQGRKGNGLELDGDAWLDLGKVGQFDRNQEFSIGLWIKIPENINKGVIFHNGIGAALYNFRGFHLAIKEGKYEIVMAHNAPENAILIEGPNIIKNEWIHLMLTYDGSGKGEGFALYINGQKAPTKIVHDNLYKNILFHNGSEPGLQIGARWRGVGIKGSIIDDVVVYNRELSFAEVFSVAHDYKLTSEQIADLQENRVSEWQDLYAKLHPKIAPIRKDLQKLRKKYADEIEEVKEIMVMKEMEKPRPTYILERGQYNERKEQVQPGVPSIFSELPDNYPANRLGLAKWLFDQKNPLFARVSVNRFWQQIFGKGLVETSEDFGNQGSLPSHPELLDWLAVSFRDSGWDLKALIKTMVLSSTFAQSSIPTELIKNDDPDNTYYARGVSKRLSAEMLRDNVLFASDLISKKIGGPSVFPYQPVDLWRINGGQYNTSSGENLYRRSLYTFWKRTVPHPTQSTFDAPTRSVCTVRRQTTNTPMQALLLMNDPIFLESARVMAKNLIVETETSELIKRAFASLTGRFPLAEEISILKEMYENEYQQFSSNKEGAAGLLNVGEYEFDVVENEAKLAAATMMISTIINSDACTNLR